MIKFIALLVVFGQVSLPTASATPPTTYVNIQNNESLGISSNWTMPLVKLENKFYYISTFYKTNWYKAYQYCRFHGLQLATITSPEENEVLTKYLFDLGTKEHFWVSGTDWGSEGSFFWMSTGTAVKYADWWPGQPDNWKGPDGETENCLCLWNPHGTGIRWNDCLCSGNLYFVCELNQ